MAVTIIPKKQSQPFLWYGILYINHYSIEICLLLNKCNIWKLNVYKQHHYTIIGHAKCFKPAMVELKGFVDWKPTLSLENFVYLVQKFLKIPNSNYSPGRYTENISTSLLFIILNSHSRDIWVFFIITIKSKSNLCSYHKMKFLGRLQMINFSETCQHYQNNILSVIWTQRNFRTWLNSGSVNKNFTVFTKW